MRNARLQVLIDNIPKDHLRLDNHQSYLLSITDHAPLAKETAIGLVVTLNVWNPGSRIAPPQDPVKGHHGVAVGSRLHESCFLKQLELMAGYMGSMAEAGGQIFVLQEVPAAPALEQHLVQSLASEFKARNLSFDLESFLKLWCKRADNKFGNAILVHQSLSIFGQATPDNPHCDFTGINYYLLKHKQDPFKSATIVNIHGDYEKPSQTALIIKQSLEKGYIVCGDFNISHSNRKHQTAVASLLQASQHAIGGGNAVRMRNLNTYDGILDGHSGNKGEFYSPALSDSLVFTTHPAPMMQFSRTKPPPQKKPASTNRFEGLEVLDSDTDEQETKRSSSPAHP
ncbi:MAG: hypothetical protein KBD23_00530 [Gammaproteobacteria bacterium]|nr:hypothetical protein [Gammaproteobacteria bacterium]